MTIYQQIMEVYPELKSSDFILGTISLRNDSDGKGDYIFEWNYSKPLPDGMKVGKN